MLQWLYDRSAKVYYIFGDLYQRVVDVAYYIWQWLDAKRIEATNNAIAAVQPYLNWLSSTIASIDTAIRNWVAVNFANVINWINRVISDTRAWIDKAKVDVMAWIRPIATDVFTTLSGWWGTWFSWIEAWQQRIMEAVYYVTGFALPGMTVDQNQRTFFGDGSMYQVIIALRDMLPSLQDMLDGKFTFDFTGISDILYDMLEDVLGDAFAGDDQPPTSGVS